MSIPRTYASYRRDDIAREYVSCDYDSADYLERLLIDYVVEVEERLAEATGSDMRAEWFARLAGTVTP